MEKSFYRVLNPLEEPKGIVLASDRQSDHRRDVFAYRKLSHDIYIVALKTGLTLLNAIRLAENVPAFLPNLKQFFESNKSEFNLMDILIDDPIKSISRVDLYAFTFNYVEHVNETGLCYDWGQEHCIWEFIWEMVRSDKFPNMPSRMDSLFLFDSFDNAADFKRENRDNDYQIVEMSLLEGSLQSFDMNWLTDAPLDKPIEEVITYSRNYWSQKFTPYPITEILFQGNYSW